MCVLRLSRGGDFYYCVVFRRLDTGLLILEHLSVQYASLGLDYQNLIIPCTLFCFYA